MNTMTIHMHPGGGGRRALLTPATSTKCIDIIIFSVFELTFKMSLDSHRFESSIEEKSGRESVAGADCYGLVTGGWFYPDPFKEDEAITIVPVKCTMQIGSLISDASDCRTTTKLVLS
jgi:hypothetical protein